MSNYDAAATACVYQVIFQHHCDLYYEICFAFLYIRYSLNQVTLLRDGTRVYKCKYSDG